MRSERYWDRVTACHVDGVLNADHTTIRAKVGELMTALSAEKLVEVCRALNQATGCEAPSHRVRMFAVQASSPLPRALRNLNGQIRSL